VGFITKEGSSILNFNLVYLTNVLIPVETAEPTLRVANFWPKSLEECVRANLDLIDEVRECARVQSKAVKWRLEMKHKSKVFPNVRILMFLTENFSGRRYIYMTSKRALNDIIFWFIMHYIWEIWFAEHPL